MSEFRIAFETFNGEQMSKEKKKPEADKAKDKKQTPTPNYRQDFIIDPNNLFWWR